jgi:hypothetical protein
MNSKPKRWNTLRASLIGAAFGAIYTAFDSTLWNLDPSEISASFIGGSIGGAALFAIVSGLRNLLVGKK